MFVSSSINFNVNLILDVEFYSNEFQRNSLRIFFQFSENLTTNVNYQLNSQLFVSCYLSLFF